MADLNGDGSDGDDNADGYDVIADGDGDAVMSSDNDAMRRV